MTITSPELTSVRETIRALRETDRRPSAHVNGLYSRLVALAMIGGYRSTEDELCESRALCAEGEANLESFWADQILRHGARVEHFPYVDNYRELATHEIAVLRRYRAMPFRHLAFVGSGPLPLSALYYEQQRVADKYTYVDNDPIALRVGSEVVTAINGSDTSRQLAAMSASDMDYSQADCVVLAALVGADTDQKLQILETMKQTLQSGAIVAVRSVPDDSRQLLYPKFSAVPQGFRLLVESHPPTGVINNIVMLEKL